MIGGSPFSEFDRGHQLGFKPPALAHIVSRETIPPSALPAFGQIVKRTAGAFQSMEVLEERRARRRRETVADARHIDQLITLVIADHN